MWFVTLDIARLSRSDIPVKFFSRRCIMRKWIWTSLLVVPLAVAGVFVYANTHSGTPQSANATGFICPITGEELPCERCCPLNQGKTSEEAAPASSPGQGCCAR